MGFIAYPNQMMPLIVEHWAGARPHSICSAVSAPDIKAEVSLGGINAQVELIIDSINSFGNDRRADSLWIQSSIINGIYPGFHGEFSVGTVGGGKIYALNLT